MTLHLRDGRGKDAANLGNHGEPLVGEGCVRGNEIS